MSTAKLQFHLFVFFTISNIIICMLESRVIADPCEWNKAILSLANTHVLQSWEWGEFKAKHGWTPRRILFYERGAICAAAQILRRPLPHTPHGIAYVPKGPLLDYSNRTLFDQTLAALELIAREERAIFIKIDPDIRLSDAKPEADAAGALANLVGPLSSRRWRTSHEQIQFKNTVLLDLAPSEEKLLLAMKPKTRYNIRLAQKRGVTITAATHDDLHSFYEMYSETSARDNFLIRQFPYYRDAWGIFVDANLAKIFLARWGDEIIAGLILFVFGNCAWYFYGASRAAHRDLMPNHLLQWEAIRWAKAIGCTTYDFWGAPDTIDELEPMYGVYRFKEGFGGTFIQHIGAYDYIVSPLLYFFYEVVRPWYIARLKSRHRIAERE
jgi:peptidoglycan pentaglycine glycine transferase (the first glycine)